MYAPIMVFYSEFAYLTCSQVSGVPPLEVCYYPVAFSYYLADRADAQRSAEEKWGQDAAWQAYKRSAATHTSPLALFKQDLPGKFLYFGLFCQRSD
jgi:hypothetical protein